jgi:hypothetical protein
MAPVKRKVEIRPTPLQKLKRKGKVLQAPTTVLNMQFSSWVSEAMPEVLWSLLLISELARDEALASFRRILDKVALHKEVLGVRRLEHSRLAELNQSSFDLFFAEECGREEIANAISPILLLEGLPDRAYWAALLPEPRDEDWERLAKAIATTFNHQSQAATDCRWLKVMTAGRLGNIVLPSSMEERSREFEEYPNRGDMRSVRPSIRAMEMILRPGTASHEIRTEWLDGFWLEGWQRTLCIPIDPDEEAKPAKHEDMLRQIMELHAELAGHFALTIEDTQIDAKHDGCFGLCFFILQLFFFALQSIVGQTVAGRHLLRSAVESYITLAFLVHHDNPTIWAQYRNFGAGQLKLAFLKRIEQQETPSFMSIDLLEELANQDMWLEHQDIKLGAWADKNLRLMAQEAGEKAFYDRYYDALSAYVHGNWSAVHHAVFGLCLNPLHRFHRVPLPPRLFIDDAIPDLKKVCNLAFDKLNKMYPPFKGRLRER